MTKYWLKATIILYILWLLLSGKVEAKFLLTGLVAAGVISWLCLKSLWIFNEKKQNAYSLLDISLWRFARYWLWLFVEIVKASLDVAKIVVKRKMPVDPQLIEFDCRFDNPIATAMLINSIILTPGTVTIDVLDGNHFVVHALTYDAAKGLIEEEMQRKIAAVFGQTY
ncbi:Na+/H+ antiporter subunit E [Ihubacter sp. mB4P-1]|uniref:Na+/H+ antiporter subunit E n=1 Tax=Ihubacter sp. mB4P-1 TaxID=3242370 RepID=UPI00137B8413